MRFRFGDIPEKVCFKFAQDFDTARYNKMLTAAVCDLAVETLWERDYITVVSDEELKKEYMHTDFPVPEIMFSCEGLYEKGCLVTSEQREKAFAETFEEIMKLVGAPQVVRNKCRLEEVHPHLSQIEDQELTNCHLHIYCEYEDEEQAMLILDTLKKISIRKDEIATEIKGIPCKSKRLAHV